MGRNKIPIQKIKDERIRNITYYKRTYAKITNKFDMNGENPETVTDRLAKYIDDIKNGIEPTKDESKDEIIMGFKVYRG